MANVLEAKSCDEPWHANLKWQSNRWMTLSQLCPNGRKRHIIHAHASFCRLRSFHSHIGFSLVCVFRLCAPAENCCFFFFFLCRKNREIDFTYTRSWSINDLPICLFLCVLCIQYNVRMNGKKDVREWCAPSLSHSLSQHGGCTTSGREPVWNGEWHIQLFNRVGHQRHGRWFGNARFISMWCDVMFDVVVVESRANGRTKTIRNTRGSKSQPNQNN